MLVQVEAGRPRCKAQHRPLPASNDQPVTFDIYVNSNVAGAIAGAASEAAELRKHTANDAKCVEWGWSLMVHGARRLNSAAFPDLHLALLSMAMCVPKSLNSMNISLMRANPRAMLSRS